MAGFGEIAGKLAHAGGKALSAGAKRMSGGEGDDGTTGKSSPSSAAAGIASKMVSGLRKRIGKRRGKASPKPRIDIKTGDKPSRGKDY